MAELTYKEQQRWSYSILISLIVIAALSAGVLAVFIYPFYAVLAGFVFTAIIWATGLIRWPATFIYRRWPK
jgi:hypothetical protein